MSDVEIIEDNSDEFRDGLDAALTRALEKVGLVAEGYAKRLQIGTAAGYEHGDAGFFF